MPISKDPPRDLMREEDRQFLEDVAVEDVEPQAVASTCADLQPVHTGFRYLEASIVGIVKPVRFRSLTLEDYERTIRDEDGGVDQSKLVMASICDANGHLYLTAQQLQELRSVYDARTWNHLLAVCMKHCLGGDLEMLAEQAAGN